MRFYLQEEEKDAICRDLGLEADQFDKVLHRARARLKELLEAYGLQQVGLLHALPVKARIRGNNMQTETRIQDDPGLASRYLAGQLSPDELQAYEQQLLENPDAVRELEATARMKVGLGKPARHRAARRAPASASRASLAWPALAAAAALVVLAVGLWRGIDVPRDATLVATARELIDRTGRPLASGSSYALLRTRSSTYDAVIELPPEHARDRAPCASGSSVGPACTRASYASGSSGACLQCCPLADPSRRLRHADRQRQRAEGAIRWLRAALCRFLAARIRSVPAGDHAGRRPHCRIYHCVSRQGHPPCTQP